MIFPNNVVRNFVQILSNTQYFAQTHQKKTVFNCTKHIFMRKYGVFYHKFLYKLRLVFKFYVKIHSENLFICHKSVLI